MESLGNLFVAYWGWITAIGGILAGLLMWATQVEPDEAINNLSKWFPWLRKRFSWWHTVVVSRWTVRGIFITLVGLSFSTGFWVGEKANPQHSSPPPEKIYIPTPTAASSSRVPTQLVANLPPSLPTSLAELGARYLLLNELIPAAKKWRQAAADSGPVLRDLMKPQMNGDIFEVRSRSVQQIGHQHNWSDALGGLKQINEQAYVNRHLDLETVPELAIPTLTAPGEEALSDGRARYDYRALHFQIGHVLKQADSLISDLEKEEQAVANKLHESAKGQQFLTGLPK